MLTKHHRRMTRSCSDTFPIRPRCNDPSHRAGANQLPSGDGVGELAAANKHPLSQIKESHGPVLKSSSLIPHSFNLFQDTQ